MTQLFSKGEIDYTIFDRQIVLSASKEPTVARQSRSISGKVTDSSNAPLPGVSVVVRGTTNGTITDADGKYSLPNIPGDATLVFSFVGMKAEEIPVSGKSLINVVLREETIGLEEVVAVGYGTQRKKDLTGSISRVTGEEILQPSMSSFDQMLQGKVAGVQIIQTSGAPGGGVNMLVRGVSSITGGNQPLYVIDGFPVSISEGSSNMLSFGSDSYTSSKMVNNTSDRINPLASVNPSDIESIEILKDASATAIYGSRGANGVVIITTKRGSLGKSQFNVDVSYGVQEVAHKMDMMDSQEYAQFVCEGRDNAWIYAGGKASDPNSVRTQATKVPDAFRDPSSITTNTDWQDVIFRAAPVQNYQISANGGNDKLKYHISGGYFNQEGIVLTSDYKRFNIRSNIDVQLLDKLRIGSTISGSYGYGNFPNTEGHYGNAGVITMALSASPTIPVYDENGDPYFNEADVTYGLGFLVNPLKVLNKNNYSDLRKKANVMVNNYLEYRIIDGLIFKSTIGVNYDAGTTKLWRSSAVPLNTTLNYPSTASATKTDNIEWLNENTLNFTRVFKEKHSLNALIGFTAQKSTFDRLSAGATSFPTNYVSYIYAGTVNSGTQIKSEWSMLSLISRINYSYAGKYLFTATLRRDGSSRFGANNKWGTFPSFSVGYNISEEKFMKSLAFISNLKLRTSYGFSGNNQIGNYATIGLLSSANYVNGGSMISGLVPSSLSNDDLTWEKSKQIDFGLELGLWQNRISLMADVYKNKKTDLLLDVELPAASGYSSSTQNVGEIENKGIELTLQTINIKSRDFNWTSNLTFSANKNKVLKLATEGARISNNAYQATQVGYSISSFYMLNAIGVFQNAQEVSTSPLQHSKVQPGDLKFEDYSHDGKITSDDQKIVNDPWPDYTWGFNNKLSYKNFSLGIIINGSQGAYTYILNTSLLNSAGVQNQLASIHRWRSESDPGDGRTPRAIRNNYAYSLSTSSYYLWDASYVRVKNINLSYSFPKELINRISLGSLVVYADVSNVLTFTDYPGYDPESSTTGNSITSSGIDYGTFPSARTYTFGVKLAF
ncbi:MAG: SusC/RagA family TonB-linked outer membrane protein [Bacteroidetes bacterium GWF2_42_66]|nr:MAG: SusC/RagA family TonB-linked outer membrane protein [Bacteroidetes bacterium GWA2_42_15]OFX98836.1 MAG: SusC/RagA family TonB-linked outer membrane protein [Bacteroidetes bacterium GWE2_42_39]OFY43195.1 MAG: SusC/RagA family TonB-linked outer membrane protein [Bacteroidetes bacterium GWF2_42_66]